MRAEDPVGMDKSMSFKLVLSYFNIQASQNHNCISSVNANKSSNAWADPQYSPAGEVADMARRCTVAHSFICLLMIPSSFVCQFLFVFLLPFFVFLPLSLVFFGLLSFFRILFLHSKVATVRLSNTTSLWLDLRFPRRRVWWWLSFVIRVMLEAVKSSETSANI